MDSRSHLVQLGAKILNGLVTARVDAFGERLGGRRQRDVDGLGAHVLARLGLDLGDLSRAAARATLPSQDGRKRSFA